MCWLREWHIHPDISCVDQVKCWAYILFDMSCGERENDTYTVMCYVWIGWVIHLDVSCVDWVNSPGHRDACIISCGSIGQTSPDCDHVLVTKLVTLDRWPWHMLTMPYPVWIFHFLDMTWLAHSWGTSHPLQDGQAESLCGHTHPLRLSGHGWACLRGDDINCDEDLSYGQRWSFWKTRQDHCIWRWTKLT